MKIALFFFEFETRILETRSVQERDLVPATAQVPHDRVEIAEEVDVLRHHQDAQAAPGHGS